MLKFVLSFCVLAFFACNEKKSSPNSLTTVDSVVAIDTATTEPILKLYATVTFGDNITAERSNVYTKKKHETLKYEPLISGDSVIVGTKVLLTANKGLKLSVVWKFNGEEYIDYYSNAYSIEILEDTDITAEFIPDPYATVTFGDNITAGRWNIDKKIYEPLINGDSVQVKSTVLFTAKTGSDYSVKIWKWNGKEDLDCYRFNKHSIEILKNMDVTVEFIPNPIITFSVVGNIGGKLAAEFRHNILFYNEDIGGTDDSTKYEPITNGEHVSLFKNNYGSTIGFEATPDSNYVVKEWKHNGNIVVDNSGNSYSLNVLNIFENIDVTVEFKQIR